MMDIEKIKALIAGGESHQLEFKKSTGQLSPAFESVTAFLNSNGGTVLIGVSNNGNIIGTEITDKNQQAISNEVSKIEPPANVQISYVDLDGTDKKVIILHVEPGLHKPYVYEGRSFQREQSTTKRMPQQLYDRFVSQRVQINFSWERMEASAYSVVDLDEDFIHGIIRAAVDVKRMPEEAMRQDIPQILEALELTKHGKVTNAAVVLFGKKVYPNFPHCQLQLARFKGLDRTEFLDIDQAYGNVFDLMEKGMTFVRRHLPIAAKIVSDKLERVETPLIPFNAIREALYNAFCHRDYTIYGGSIALAIYDDRLELANHGALYEDATIEKIKHGFSKRRNPIISEVFYRSNLIEKWDRGIQKMITMCLADNDTEPDFFADAFEFKVTFPFQTSLKPPVFGIENLTASEEILTPRQSQIVEILS